MFEKKAADGYPRFSFWEPRRQITIVNRQDFPEKEILRSLGISNSPLVQDFGIHDVDEIRSRQGLIRYMLENPEFMEWLLRANSSSPLPGMEYGLQYERIAEDFLRYFDPNQKHTPFWQMVHDVVGFLDKESLPAKLDLFKKTIDQAHLELAENHVGERISEQIQNVALIEGTMTFIVKTSEKKDQHGRPVFCNIKALDQAGQFVHGFKKFSRSLLSVQGIDSVPGWTKNQLNPLNWIGIGKLVARRARKRDREEINKAFRGTVINSAESQLVTDVKNGLLPILAKLSWKTGRLVTESRITVFFTYTKDGLQVRVLSWEPHVEVPKELKYNAPLYQGYPPELIKEIERGQKAMNQIHMDTFIGMEMANLVASVKKQRPDLFSRTFLFPSPTSDLIYKWYAISNLYKKNFKKDYAVLTAHREFFFEHLATLKNIAYVANALSAASKKIDYPLCWPKLVTDGKHVVSFDEIMPIHLLEHLKAGNRPVPLSGIPEINGDLVGFTGSHEGGKTTASLAVVVLVYLAQSGLPVFSKNVKLNPKSLLGMVFLTRGEGPSSTARTLADKMVNVLNASKNVNPAEVIVVFDELGEGTQELSGDKLGRDVLTKLKERGVSVLFNTQITSLAEYAEKELCAICLRFDANHHMSSGIGTGDMEGLRKRSGLDDALRA